MPEALEGSEVKVTRGNALTTRVGDRSRASAHGNVRYTKQHTKRTLFASATSPFALPFASERRLFTMEPSISGSPMDNEGALKLPGIYPPPNGAHKDCLICEGHFPSVKTQQQNEIPHKDKLDDISAQKLLSYHLSDTQRNL